MRSGPGKQYSIVWELGKGFPVKILQRKNSWVQISDFEKDKGWIHSSLLSDSPHVIVKVNKNSSRKINIRSGPSTRYEVVGKAYYGVVFHVLEKKSGWAKVEHHTGVKGWIKLTLLWGAT